MRNLISIMLLIVCFALPSFSMSGDVSKTPVTACVDLDHVHSDFIASADAIGVIMPVIFIGAYESAMVNSFTVEKTTKAKTFIRKGRDVDYSMVNSKKTFLNYETNDFDYSFNKLLIQS